VRRSGRNAKDFRFDRTQILLLKISGTRQSARRNQACDFISIANGK